MAARFWRFLLGGQLLYAVAVTAVLAAALSLSAGELVLTAVVVTVSAPCALVASSYLAGRVAARRDGAGDRTPLRGLAAALLRETLALCAATFAMIAEPCRRPPRADSARAAAASPVLLIHGLACNRAVWRPLLAQLAARGFAPIRAVNLEPLFTDIESHTASVVRELRELQRASNGAPVAIVAHSMGGLVARAALRAGGPGLVSRVVTIASPHHGTALARLFPSLPARQMRPGSSWLQALNASQEGALPVPVTSIYSVHDNLIAPPRSAVLAGAQLHELAGLGHLSLLRARPSLERALAALAGP
ncbi:MAG TPA: alpha/beta fold hydrolase [Steroidobacteraceae bacterium]|nr:alpha/beta fold hydrolase [Steroidobacteraceae bacterium]